MVDSKGFRASSLDSQEPKSGLEKKGGVNPTPIWNLQFFKSCTILVSEMEVNMSVKHTLDLQKSTKGAHVYGDAKITGFYIPKEEVESLTKDGTIPKQITLVIDVPNGNGQ